MAESVNFKIASEITPIDSHTYKGLSTEAWSVKGITQGGIAIGLLTAAARKHFDTTHATLNQPHSTNIQATFLRPTPIGPLLFKITDTKLGRSTSTIHISILNPQGQPTLVAYILQSNLATMAGPTRPSPWLHHLPALPAKTDLASMLADRDPNWVHHTAFVQRSGIPCMEYHHMFEPRAGMADSCFGDRWVAARDDVGGWTNALIGHLGDLPYVPLGWDFTEDHWTATLAFSVELKKAFPEDGARWALVRTSIAGLKDGRMDYNSVIVDDAGEVVALVNQVMVMVGNEKRGGGKSQL